ncbi:hypothetical protein NA56DRAFT_697212 [Hyaloscypha hepaticicola]|uniref:VOC domain-containing protein n=1 Tax=Hyaloscypha hepaticicola TaxID=2082293 RepID=A0A2J6QLA4_9HELO|nr:hypothetical protein NA56DRAFT_697212 [Hyaloscypha hepaticicola]
MADNIANTLSSNRAWADIVCYVEIPANDVQACKEFYAAIFPSWVFTASTLPLRQWNFTDPDGLFGAITQAQPGYWHELNAMISMAGEAMVATISQCVESIDKVKLKVEEHGGEARSAKELAADGYYYMLFKDPEGNRFYVYEKSGQ